MAGNKSDENNASGAEDQVNDKASVGSNEDLSLPELLGNLFSTQQEDGFPSGLMTGLKNLNKIKPFPPKEPYVRGKHFEKGVMGFRRNYTKLVIAVACGKAQVRYLDLNKYIALVENMHDPISSTIMIQNFSDEEDRKSAKGQVLGRINPDASAIQIIQGLTGRVIHSPSDISLFDVYYLDRAVMTAFYLAAKAQMGHEHELENMIAAYEGWKAFQVPLDPFKPYGD